MKSVISVQKLNKEFQFYKKQEGLRGSVRNLFKRRMKIKKAVKDVSFEIQEGEFIGFIGPNGAGKTTTIKMLSGILEPTSGVIEVLGYIPVERKSEYLKQIGVVLGQKNQIDLDLPPIETFLLMKEIYELSDKDYSRKLKELITLLDIRDIVNVQARRLSLGQRMKCELVVALLHSPKVLYLDEPTIGLDVTSQHNIREFLSTYNRLHKTTIILTSHYMQDIEKLCERIIIIDLGKVIFDGALSKLLKSYVKNKKILITIQNMKDSDCGKAAEFGNVIECDIGKIIVEVPRRKVTEVTAELIKNLPVADLTISEIDIEEVITRIFEENKKSGKR